MTETSEMREETIKLGKLIVSELAANSTEDFLARWMANYIGELIAKTKKANFDEKAELEAKCFDTILRLWEHRYSSSAFVSIQPYARFLEVLQRLDPDEKRPFFLNFKEISKNGENDVTASLLNFVLKLDHTTRHLMSQILAIAAKSAEGQNTAEMIENVLPENLTSDLGALNFVLNMGTKEGSEENPGRTAECVQAIEDFCVIANSVKSLLKIDGADADQLLAEQK